MTKQYVPICIVVVGTYGVGRLKQSIGYSSDRVY
jgi:hypothetical protein